MIVLLGAGGYVGTAFVAHLTAQKTPFTVLSRGQWDPSRPQTLQQHLRDTKATFLINCVGYTGKPNVDACELHKQECLYGNAILPEVVAKACDELGVAWGHVSSGCIFTGDRGRDKAGNVLGFAEEHAPNFSFRQNNCSFYSGTKALGEEILGYREVPDPGGTTLWEPVAPAKGYIWRLRIPFDEKASPRNYLTKVMTYAKLLEARNSLSQLGEFVRACTECWEKKVPFGIYNVTNPGSVTTREVVALIENSAVGKALVKSGKSFSYFEDEGVFMKTAAKTPRSNCVLDSSKLAAAGIVMSPVTEALERSLRNWQAS
ncbi:dTDP-4-dehydrorhamnose reductase [Verrucomicrobia bacterium LW23]|nr:dTDP-4-dehydrorhamnose reductase [Verrucomicrobia bacterium LW23]